MPTPLGVAPGQLLTVIVQGIGTGLSQTAPSGVPLPNSLANITASYTQLQDVGLPILVLPVPILKVRPFTTIAAPYSYLQGTKLAAITLQTIRNRDVRRMPVRFLQGSRRTELA